MLYFSRWKATAILLTTLLVCAFAIPNFFPDAVVQSWPRWAQRHMVLGLDLQRSIVVSEHGGDLEGAFFFVKNVHAGNRGDVAKIADLSEARIIA